MITSTIQLQYNTIQTLYLTISIVHKMWWNQCPEHLQTEQTNCWSHKLWLTKDLYWIKNLLRLNWLTYHITTMSDLWQSSRKIFSRYYILWKDWLKTCLHHCLVEPRTAHWKYFPEKAEYNKEYFTLNKAHDRVFQGLTDPERELLVMQGKYGIKQVHTCLTVFSKILGIEKNNGLVLMEAHASDLVKLCQTVYVMSSSAYI